jgi:hypothetical protein
MHQLSAFIMVTAMFSSKKMLCPIDFSEFSMKAVEAAETPARTFHAKLMVIQMVMPVNRMPYHAVSTLSRWGFRRMFALSQT